MKILEDKGYIYQKHLSTGGEGEVHLIKSVNKNFIAKIFPTLSDASIDVLKTIQKLDIEGIPKIHDIFNYQDKTIIIRDYVEGTTLYDEIKKNEYLSLNRAKTIIINVSKTLRQLHNTKPKPIIYRDLKPENIIITPEGDIQLIDFGIARYYKIESTRDTVIAGTKGYTAPEVMAGMQSDTRSDVYSTGLLFYEMLTGKNLLVSPFQIRPVKESNEYLPEWIDDIIEKATDLNQTKRYRIIEEFIDAIENPVINKSQLALKPKLIKRIAICLVAIIIIGGAFVILSKQNVSKKDNLSMEVTSANSNPVINEEEMKESNSNEHLVINNVSQNQDNYDILLDLEFDGAADFQWMFLHGDQLKFADSVQKGIFNLNQEINMKYKLSANSFYHMRIRPDNVDKNGTLLLLCFAPQLSSEWSESSYEIKFDNKQPFAGEIRNDYGYYFKEAKGIPMLVDNYWIDVIVCLDEEGKTFRYFIADVENSAKMVYGGTTVFDSWVGDEYQISIDLFFEHWQDVLGQKMPTSEVEFIRQGIGSIQKYLEENVEAYQKNKSKVDEFIDTEIEFIGEDQFTQHGY